VNRPPTPLDIPTSDKPSMGDPDVVDGLVRAMLLEANKALFAAEPGSNPQDTIKQIALKWGKLFYAGNDDYQQTLTPEGQAIWLQQHGLGAEDTELDQPVLALVAETLKRFTSASMAHANGQIDDEQLQFRLDAAVEDCVMMLLGLENSAD
jgi:hypothetical protein